MLEPITIKLGDPRTQLPELQAAIVREGLAPAPINLPASSEPSQPSEQVAWLRVAPVSAPVEQIEVDGAPESFWCARLDLEGLSRIALLSAQDKEGKIVLVAEGHLCRLLAAGLFVCLRKDKTGIEPLFESWEDAFEVAHSTHERTVDANTVLFEKMLEINPKILPDRNARPDAEPSGKPAPIRATRRKKQPAKTEAGNLNKS